jgi:photosystem II stability/assembly factor-like uncharacterized protein
MGEAPESQTPGQTRIQELESNTLKIIWVLTLALSLHLFSMGCQPSEKPAWEILHRENSNNSPAQSILKLDFVNSTQGFALTSSDLLETRDGGRKWVKLIESDENPLSVFQSFFLWDDSHIWIVGSQKVDSGGKQCGLIWTTSNSGKTWRKLTAPMVQNLLSTQFCTEEIGWSIGANVAENQTIDSVILHTNDGGQTWTERDRQSSSHANLIGIVCFSCEDVLAARNDGIIFSTPDGGKNWVQRDIKIASSLLRVRHFGDQAWVLGTNGTVFRSDDRGATWKRVSLNTKESLLDILILGQNGWIVGDNGNILSSSNGGSTWYPDFSGTSNNLFSLSSKSSLVWAGGEKLTVLQFGRSN